MNEAGSPNNACHDLHSGQIRGIQSIQSSTVSELMPPQEPSTCPTKIQNYNDNQFNQEMYNNHAQIVQQCTGIVESTLSSDVKLEGPGMKHSLHLLYHAQTYYYVRESMYPILTSQNMALVLERRER